MRLLVGVKSRSERTASRYVEKVYDFLTITNTFQVYAEATVVFPLIVAATFAKASPEGVQWLE